MQKPKQKLLWLLVAGLFSVIFLTLITISFYNYVLKAIGVNKVEQTRTFRYHFAMIVSDTDSGFWTDVYNSLQKEAEKNNAYVEKKGVTKSAEYSMEEYMDMAIAARVDGIFLEFRGGEHLTAKIKEATEAGIPVITLMNDAPKSERKSYVGINSYRLGQEYGNKILNLLPKTGEVRVSVLLHTRSMDSSQLQIFSQINNRLMTSKDTEGRVRVEEIRIPSDTAFDTERIAWGLFKTEEEAPDLVVCMDEVDTKAVCQSIIDHNRVGKTRMIGYYKSKDTLEAIQKGTIDLSLYINTEEMGRLAVKAMMECMDGGRTNSFYSVDLAFINKDNVQEYRDGKQPEETK